jgi:hypothetical protein
MSETDERPVNEAGESLNKDGSVSKNQPTERVRVVAYTGLSTVRMISAEAWKSVGIDAPDRVWAPYNDMKIALSEFNQDELDYLAADGEFNVFAEVVEEPAEAIVRSPEWNSD